MVGPCRDAADWLPRLPAGSVDLFFTSPPYADARSYSPIRPDDYVEWFEPFARAMREATAETGSFVLNIKNRVASSGRLRGQRHPYVYELVLSLQRLGWRWLETYIWAKPNAIPGRFGPRTKDSFEYVCHFAKGSRPYFDIDAIRVPYKAGRAEISRRRKDRNGRRNTEAGFGRDRTRTYQKGGADPGNVIRVSQTYNQHKGPAGRHTAVMPEGLAEFFVKAACPKCRCLTPNARFSAPPDPTPTRWPVNKRSASFSPSPAVTPTKPAICCWGGRRNCEGQGGQPVMFGR